MKRTILAFAALAALNAGAVTTANAVELVVAPGRVYVGPDRHYGDEDYVGCRTIVEYRINRFGEAIEVRRRVCDW